MLDLCKNTGLGICNGRLGEDCDKGDYTFFCRRGRSVVDYLLTPYNLLNLIFNFQIGPKHIDSDHRPITFALQMFSHFTNQKSKPPDTNVEDHRPRYIYKWCPEKQSEYQVALRSSKCLAIIENLACDLCEKPSSDYLSTQINTLTETAANGLFKKHLVNKKLEQKCFPSNSWFDSECKLLKNEVNRFGHQHDIAIPKNSDTYFDLCKKYKQLVQKKKRTHIKKCKQELQCLTNENPNNYWGFLKNLKRKSTQDEVDIDLSDFYFCFLKQSTPPQGQIYSSLLKNKISSWKDGNPPFNIKIIVSQDNWGELKGLLYRAL